MPRILEARNPVRKSESSIDVEIRLEDSEEWLPFTASENDPEEYGRSLYEMADRGDFGEVS